MPKLDRTLQAAIRQDFGAFSVKAFQTIGAGNQYMHNWHLDALAHQLTEVAKGTVARTLHHAAAPLPQVTVRVCDLHGLVLGPQSWQNDLVRQLLARADGRFFAFVQGHCQQRMVS